MLHLDAGDTLELKLRIGNHIKDIALNIELTGLGFDYVVYMMTLKIMRLIKMRGQSGEYVRVYRKRRSQSDVKQYVSTQIQNSVLSEHTFLYSLPCNKH